MKHHESGEPFRISVTGIDGAGKDSVTKAVLQRASFGLNVIKLGRPAYELHDGNATEIYRRTTESIDVVHGWADGHRSRRMIMGVNALNVMTQTRVLEPLAARRQPAPDMIASSRDPRLDPAVYFEYYASKAAKSVSVPKRIERMQQLTGVSRDLIITLRIDPELAVKRIESRMAEEAIQRSLTEEESAGMRDKWRHMHENVDDLAMLAAGYAPADRYLQEIQPHRSVTIDTSARSFDEVVDVAYDVIMNARDDTIKVGETINL